MKRILLGLLLALMPGLAQAQTVQGRATNGSPTSGNPVWVCGSDGTNCRAIKTDSTGTVAVSPGTVTVICASGCSASTGGQSVNIFEIGGAATTNYLSTVVIGTVTTSFGTVAVTPAVSPWNITIAGSPQTVLTTPTASPAAVIGVDPCAGQTKTNSAFTTAAVSIALVPGVAGKKVYVCSLSVIAAAALQFNLVEGTAAFGSLLPVIGSTTATSGMSLSSGGGMTYGSGSGSVAQTAIASNTLFLYDSTGALISGNLSLVQQ